MAVRNRKMKYTVREVVLLCALLCVLAVHVWTVRTRPRNPCNTVLDSENALLHESRMKRTVVGNHEVVYELPIGFVKTQTGFYKLGTVLAFHGCNHHATDFWDRSNECPECLGLPEEKKIKKQVLDMGLAFVAISANSRCWSLEKYASQRNPGRKMSDLEAVRAVVQTLPWIDKDRVFAFGASSGGAFVFALANELKLKGAIVQIMGLPVNFIKEYNIHKFPRKMCFMHMPRDLDMADKVKSNIGYLESNQVQVKEMLLNPEPLTVESLSVAMDTDKAKKIIDVLIQKRVIDEDGMLIDNPRQTYDVWRKAAAPITGEMSLSHDMSPLFEILNVKYASHEIFSHGIKDAFAWIV